MPGEQNEESKDFHNIITTTRNDEFINDLWQPSLQRELDKLVDKRGRDFIQVTSM